MGEISALQVNQAVYPGSTAHLAAPIFIVIGVYRKISGGNVNGIGGDPLYLQLSVASERNSFSIPNPYILVLLAPINPPSSSQSWIRQDNRTPQQNLARAIQK